MKVSREVDKRNLTSFRNIKPGTVFIYKSAYLMKIWWRPDNIFLGSRTIPVQGTHTAVHLETGSLHAISIDERVEVIDGEYRIKT